MCHSTCKVHDSTGNLLDGLLDANFSSGEVITLSTKSVELLLHILGRVQLVI